jgi:hypothetical protein
MSVKPEQPESGDKEALDVADDFHGIKDGHIA